MVGGDYTGGRTGAADVDVPAAPGGPQPSGTDAARGDARRDTESEGRGVAGDAEPRTGELPGGGPAPAAIVPDVSIAGPAAVAEGDAGTAGKDKLYGGGGDDRLYGEDGDDVLSGGAGRDQLRGGAGDDTFVVTGADDARDRLLGGDGADRIVAGDDGDITLNRFSKSDSVEVIDGGATESDILGTGGNDNLDFSQTTFENIGGVDAGGGKDTVRGTTDGELIDGGAGKDKLYGGGGDDDLRGGTGDDRIYGEDGDDVLIGGAGRDDLRGGAGDDTFVFEAGGGSDRVEDFLAGDALLFRGDEFSIDDISIVQKGKDAIITFGGENAVNVTVRDTDADSLQGYSISEGAGDAVLVTVDTSL